MDELTDSGSDNLVTRADDLSDRIEAADTPSRFNSTWLSRLAVTLSAVMVLLGVVLVVLVARSNSEADKADDEAAALVDLVNVLVGDVQALREQAIAAGEVPVVPAPTADVLVERGATGDVGPPGRPPTAQEIADAIDAHCAGTDQPCRGVPGVDGDDGERGERGVTGSPGPQGTPGIVGSPGVAGVPGATGARGLPGATGPVGATGVNGLDGQNGANGLDGAAGPAGPQGEPGPAGAQGEPGAAGLPPSSFTFTAAGVAFVCVPSPADVLAFTCAEVVAP